MFRTRSIQNYTRHHKLQPAPSIVAYGPNNKRAAGGSGRTFTQIDMYLHFVLFALMKKTDGRVKQVPSKKSYRFVSIDSMGTRSHLVHHSSTSGVYFAETTAQRKTRFLSHISYHIMSYDIIPQEASRTPGRIGCLRPHQTQ